MNTFRLPAYVVLEIPSPISDAIAAIRRNLATPTSRLPVEITVAGSSGVGPISPGTDIRSTEQRLQSVLSKTRTFSTSFSEVRRFPNTNIFYLAPQGRADFDRIHQELAVCGIPFGSNQFPYNPHCTLRTGPMTDGITEDDICALSFPRHEFTIETVSIYEYDSETVTCYQTFQAKI